MGTGAKDDRRRERSEPSEGRSVMPRTGRSVAAVTRELFGYGTFRPGQEGVLAAVMAGRDCVGVLPTGGGKSLTFQVAARVLGTTALVVTPLVSLMRDQVAAARRRGLAATSLDASVESSRREEILRELAEGRLELLYVSPEALEGAVRPALLSAPIGLLVVDEAHCISEWGHDFRPAYRRLGTLRAELRGVPALALTATATPAVIEDICDQLEMRDPDVHVASFFRPNLRIEVRPKETQRQADERIVSEILSRRGDGIAYCLTQAGAETFAARLRRAGVRAAAYHAGLEPEERGRVQDAFLSGEVRVVAATIAFGMGVDKPNVRFVIHRGLPSSVAGWYQEMGRAGRDGQPSACILYVSWRDVADHDRLVGSSDADEASRQRARRLVREAYRLASLRVCRHAAIADHFGERVSRCADACDVCAGPETVGEAPRRPDAERAVEAEGVLRDVRTGLARRLGVPAFVVMHDTTLRAIAERMPTTGAELLTIRGMGRLRVERFGPEILAALRLIE
jgi:ATP-dependent DNA helicase RecQ